MTPRGQTAGTVTITENLLKRKWSIVILRHLSLGLTDPASIRRAEKELTLIALNERLRTMHRYGLITRHPRRTSGKVIEYHLTERGQRILRLLTLVEQLEELQDQDEIALDRIIPAGPPPPVEPRKPGPDGKRLGQTKAPARTPAVLSPATPLPR